MTDVYQEAVTMWVPVRSAAFRLLPFSIVDRQGIHREFRRGPLTVHPDGTIGGKMAYGWGYAPIVGMFP